MKHFSLNLYAYHARSATLSIDDTGRHESHELLCQLFMGSSSPVVLGGGLAHCEVVVGINKCSFISVSAQGITNTGRNIQLDKGENRYARATLSERLLGK